MKTGDIARDLSEAELMTRIGIAERHRDAIEEKISNMRELLRCRRLAAGPLKELGMAERMAAADNFWNEFAESK
jgi:hypothetical protein